MWMFGQHELGARLFGALLAIGAMLAVYWAGVGLFRRRAGLLGALALGTMPLFILQARPETVWSARTQPSAATRGGSAMDYILSGMLAGKRVG